MSSVFLTRDIAGVPGDASTPCTLRGLYCAKLEAEATEGKLDMLRVPLAGVRNVSLNPRRSR